MNDDNGRQQEIRQSIHDNASISRSYLMMNVLSTIVASYGMLAGSTAVVIGAMVIATLLGPITGIALGLVDGDNRLLRKAFVTEMLGIGVVVLISFAIGRIHQNIPVSDEITSRTAPNIFDLIIALAGGAAGAYATASPRISAGLVGVAIATALVPPLAAFGILVARGSDQLAAGALILFFANFVAIQFASSLVLWSLGYHNIMRITRQTSFQVLARNAFSGIVLLGLAAVLGFNFTQTITKEVMESRVNKIITDNIRAFPDAQLVDIEIDQADSLLNLLITVRTSRQLTYTEIVALQEEVAIDLQQPVAIKIIDIPTIKLDPLVPPTQTPTPNATQTQTMASGSAPIPPAFTQTQLADAP